MSAFLERLFALAQATPEAIAIEEAGGAALSYAALVERVGRLGSLLIEHGIGPEQRVALALPKSIDFVVSALACFYAGAAFVPLDPALPRARRADYLKRAKVRCVLGDDATLDTQGMLLLSPRRALEPSPLREPCPPAPERLAYVIFSSGSTGAPKGIAVTQRGLVPMLDAQIARFGLRHGMRCLWLLSSAFDASISDLGTALLSGATLCIPEASLAADPQALHEYLQRERIGYVDLPPSLLPYLPRAPLPALELIVIGGEVPSAEAVRYWAARVRLISVYGPTEATVCTSSVRCTDAWGRAELGSPFPAVRYALCDAQGQLVEAGTPGELWIAGAQLARGYLDDEALTAQRFVLREGTRWFKTGDLARYDSDGALVFLGRVDRQLKRRGVLVSPEEVEARLAELPCVRRAAVVVQRESQALVGFLESSDCDLERVREHLRAHLPSAAIPDTLHVLERIPSTASGKPDLSLLSECSVPQASAVQEADTAQLAPSEARLLELYRRVLKREVAPDDDFFALGGHSLQLLELVALASEANLTLSVQLVHNQRSARQLARALAAEAAASDARSTEELTHLLAPELSALQALSAAPPLRTAQAQGHEGTLLVTGATGFLGARIVYELLQQSSRELELLVRARTPEHAMTRLERALWAHGLSLSQAQRARIRSLLGDLTQANLGLPESEFRALAERSSVVFHSAAAVSLMADSASLWDANVRGTANVLRLVHSGRPKALHYASTLSVFVATDECEGSFYETCQLDTPRRVYGGYAQTKWAAERLVRSVPSRAASTFIHRLGLLSADSQSAIGPTQDWLARTLRGLTRLGVVPLDHDPDLALDITPVDFAARAIVGLALSEQPAAQMLTTHLAAPRALLLGTLVEALEHAGVSMRRVARAEFVAATRKLLEGDCDSETAVALLALERTYAPRGESHRALDLLQATRCRFDTTLTRALLAPLGIVCDSPRVEHFSRYIQHVLAHGETHAAD